MRPPQDASGAWPPALSGLVLFAPPVASDEDPMPTLIAAFDWARAAESRLLPQAAEKAVFATVTRLGGRFGLDGSLSKQAALAGGLSGLAKSAAQEWPQVSCRALDVSDDDEPRLAASVLADELTASTAQVRPLELGFKGDVVYTTRLRRADLARAELQEAALLSAGDLVVVSGGARGVTAAVVQRLAEAYQPSFLILGRSAEPGAEAAHLAGLTVDAAVKNALVRAAGGRMTPRELKEAFERVQGDREIRANLKALRDRGLTVLYRAADVRDAAAIAAVVDEARASLGPVRMLVHGAGVLHDRLIKDKTRAQVEAVLGTKLAGLEAMMRAADPAALKGLVLFSSSTGRFGRKGQSDYAVANDALNKLAQHYRSTLPDCRTLAINWGPWDGGMVTPALKSLFSAEGIEVIGVDAGSSYLLRELQQRGDGPEIVILGPGSRNPSPVLAPPATIAVNAHAVAAAEMSFDVSVEALPILRDHVLNGRAVLPAAMMLEYLAIAAAQHNPGLTVIGLEDFRVLKGVTLAPDESVTLVANCRALEKRGGEFICAVDIRVGALPNARATVVMAAAAAPARAAKIPSETDRYDDMAGVYGRVLFHGPALQGLTAIHGLSASGATATAAAHSTPDSFQKQPLRPQWITQPLTLDCVFQLMIVWSDAQLGARSLPAAIKSYRQFGAGITGRVCELRLAIRQTNAGRAVADCEILRADGSLAALIEGYEATVEPALERAFQRNQLAASQAPTA